MEENPTPGGYRSYEWTGPGGPLELLLTDGVFAPTPTSREVAEALSVEEGNIVIDVGSGSGVLSFVAARMGASHVFGTELNAEAVRVARMNAERLGLEGVVEFHEGSLFDPVAGVRADVVIGDVSGVPDDIARESDWFPGGFSGGPTGAEVPVAMIEAAAHHLRPGGRFYLPTGSIQNEPVVLAAARRVFDTNMRKVRERLFPLPAKVADSALARRLMESGVVSFIRRGSRLLWELRVWECRLPVA